MLAPVTSPSPCCTSHSCPVTDAQTAPPGPQHALHGSTLKPGRGGRRYFPTLLIVLLAVFNDGAMIALSKDRVRASALPDTWNLRNIFISGAPLGLKHPCAALEPLCLCPTSLSKFL